MRLDAAAEFERCRRHLEQTVVEAGGVEGEWSGRVARGIAAALELASADPAAALVVTDRALTRWKRREPPFASLVERLATLLEAGAPPRNPRLPSAQAIVVLIAKQVNLRIESGRAGELPAIAPDLTFLALFPCLGYTEARRRAQPTAIA
ncbi:MAG TPA: hypothetical protein VHA54_08600 [Solirubrobacterales bacterium]|nr:hypothetical protein [Solirubrobacterales bacterium]